jgi:glycosyltransferase involved in cell wall biosynthesis
LHVAFDIRKGFERSGTGIVAQNLIKNLVQHHRENQYFLYGTKVPHRPEKGRPLFALLYEFIWKQLFMPWYFRARGVKISFHTYPVVPILSSTLCVAIIYDMISHTEPSERSWSNRIMLASLRLCAKKSKLVVTISHYSKSEIVRFLRVKPEKVIVAYPGIDHILEARFVQSQVDGILGFKGRYILAVLGSFAPRKNGLTLIRSYEGLNPKLRSEYKLVIVAKRSGADWRNVQLELEKPGLRENVIITWADDEKALVALYSKAELLVHMTLHEGFGLPVVEAMALGVPVISSNKGAIAEIAGTCAILGNPKDVGWVSKSITEVLADANLREQLTAKARERAAIFSWKRMADVVATSLSTISAGQGRNAEREPFKEPVPREAEIPA